MNAVTLPWPAKALSPNFRSRSHWPRTNAIKGARHAAHYLTTGAGIVAPADGPILVGLTFNPPTNRNRDEDNLIASCKAYLDGIADALGVNDSRFKLAPPSIGETVKGGQVVVVIG